ncbi:MAG TPA: N-acetylmuramoyl-L-alanine amidase [Rudaea sp.]|jgi:N-acetyl-anhydromuramyl-L-alanine amidase AmpD|nr:N-acetylmuramoyl-L-alanine amidase [Rudaea sp.]
MKPDRPLLRTMLFMTMLAIGGCASSPNVDVPSANQDGRVRFLVLHFTDENFERSLDLLTRPHENPVSAHYLVSRAGEYRRPTPTVLRLVDESRRAWHAGPSRFQGHELLNDDSIGIEIVYESHCSREPPRPAGISPWEFEAHCDYPPYPSDQIATVIGLARQIVQRHPDIDPTRVVGHSDIQPENKTDPGPAFPWQRLAASGIGAWFEAADVDYYRAHFDAHPPAILLLQEALAAYGYGNEASGMLDRRTRDLLSAFQCHFMPGHRSGEVDAETAATLFALLVKYRADELGTLRDRHADLPASPRPRSNAR